MGTCSTGSVGASEAGVIGVGAGAGAGEMGWIIEGRRLY